jgi:transcriptional regulator EpsA
MVGAHVESMAHVIETAIEVRRRYQFFVWTQSSFQRLIPHKVAICGVYERARKEVQLEAFNSVTLPEPALELLTNGQSAFMRQVVIAWIHNSGRPLVVRLSAMASLASASECEALLAAGFDEFLVHGVSRPQRASEIESFFIFASPREQITEQQRNFADLLLPHLHSTYLRVQSTERECSDSRPSINTQGAYVRAKITGREEEILSWIREGMSNHQIGTALGISPLTVKNHVQKILRKLGATNRAQAVARAMSMNMLERSGSNRPPEAE